jgi:hypothetical protein
MSGPSVEVEPGTKWVYSNHGFAALGQIVEDVRGQSLDQYLREHILRLQGWSAPTSSDRNGSDPTWPPGTCCARVASSGRSPTAKCRPRGAAGIYELIGPAGNQVGAGQPALADMPAGRLDPLVGDAELSCHLPDRPQPRGAGNAEIGGQRQCCGDGSSMIETFRPDQGRWSCLDTDTSHGADPGRARDYLRARTTRKRRG